jgi:hypothetical protein
MLASMSDSIVISTFEHEPVPSIEAWSNFVPGIFLIMFLASVIDEWAHISGAILKLRHIRILYPVAFGGAA